MLITKFTTEIERLKAENGHLLHSRDSVTAFYQQEFNNLWQKYKVYSGDDEQQTHEDHSRITEAQETKEELREMTEELKIWIETVRTEEIKALQDKLSLALTKEAPVNVPKPRKSNYGSLTSQREPSEKVI